MRELLTAVSWISNDDGFWDVGSNWSTGQAPSTGDDVTIDIDGFSPVITVRDSRTVNSINSHETLVLTNGVFQVTTPWQINDSTTILGIGGALLTNAGVTVANSGILDLKEGAIFGTGLVNSGTITISTTTNVRLSGQLVNNGTITHTGEGVLLLDAASKLTNSVGAIYEFASDGDVGKSAFGTGFSPIFQNDGTLKKTSGTGTSKFTAIEVNCPGGTIDIQMGQLEVAGGGRWQNAVVNANGDGVVKVSSTILVTDGLSGSGTGHFELTGALEPVSGGTPTLDFDDGVFQWTAGSLNFNWKNIGSITVAGPDPKAFYRANVSNTGHFIFSGTGVVDFAPDNAPSTLTNQIGAVVEMDGAVHLIEGNLNNLGTLRKVGAGTALVEIRVDMHATSVVDAHAGVLNLAGAGTWTSPTLNASANALVLTTGTYNVEGTLTGSGAGHVELAGGWQSFVNTLTLNFAGDYFQWTAGHLFGNTITNIGTVNLVGADTKYLYRTLFKNEGTVVVSGPGTFDFSADGFFCTMLNQPNGLLELHDDVQLIEGTLDNHGTVRKTGTGTAVLSVEVKSDTAAPIEALAGELKLTGGGTWTGGTLEAAPGASINFAGGQFYISDGLTGSGSGRIALSGASLNANIAAASLDFPNGEIYWTGGAFYGYQGPWTNHGALIIDGAGAKQFYRSTFINEGQITVAGTGQINFGDTFVGSTLLNQPGAVLDLQSDARFFDDARFGPARIINRGTVRKSAGLGVNSLELNFDNDGVLDVQSGTVSLQRTVAQFSGTTLTSGEWIVGAFASITASNATNLTTNLGHVTLDGPSSSFPLINSLTTNRGTFTLSDGRDFTTVGNLLNSGELSVGPGSTLTVNGTLTETPAASSLVSWWRSDGNATDSAGTNNGTLTGNTSFVQGEFDEAFSFDGTGDLVTLGNPVGLRLQDFTISAWVKRDSLATGAALLFGYGQNGYGLSLTADGHLSLSQVHVSEVKTTGLQIADTDFHHVAVTKSGTRVTFYLDGVAETVDPYQVTFSFFTNAAIGGRPDNANSYFTGSIDELAVFNRPLTGEEVESLRVNNDPPGIVNPPPTIAIQIDGTPVSQRFGRLAVTGAAQFSGALSIENVNGFGPTLGDEYQIMNYASRTGSLFPQIGLAPFYDAVIDNTETVLTVATMAADVAVTSIDVPLTATPGLPVSIQYEVENQRTDQVVGDWIDSLYLSTDDVFDPSDTLLGRVEHTGGLGPLAAYTGTLMTDLPPVVDGDYRVIVIAASRGQVADANRVNNKLASDPFAVTVPLLETGTPVTRTLNNGEDILYRLANTANVDQLLSVDFDLQMQGEVFVKYGQLPTRSDFDFVAADVFELQRALALPPPGGLPVYVLIHGREGANGGTQVQLKLENIAYTLQSTSQTKGANVGPVTTTLRGVGLTRNTVVELLNGQGVVAATATATFINPNELSATFDLNGLIQGQYDMRITDGGLTDVLSDAFQVISGRPGDLRIDVVMPGSARGGRVVTGYVDYTNTGLTDLVAPLVFITSPTASVMTLNMDAAPDSTRLRIVGTGQLGPAGILRAGEKVRIPFRILANAEIFSVQTEYILADSQTPMDWDVVREDLQALQISDPQFEAVMAQMIAQVGDTQGDYVRMLAENASLLPASPGDPRNIADLQALEYRRAQAAINTSISGHTVSDDPRIPLAGLLISAFNQDTQRAFTTTTLNDGSFSFENVTPGHYIFRFQAGLTTIESPLAVTAGQHVVAQEVVISPDAQLTGTIVRPNGQPIPQANVYLFEGEDLVANALTDAQGQYVLTHLVPGQYNLLVSPEGYERTQVNGLVLELGENTTNVEVNDVPARIHGHVTLDGAVPEFVYISARDESSPVEINFYSVRAEEDGSFVIDSLPAGVYTIVFMSGETAVQIEGVVVGTSEQVEVGSIEMHPAIVGGFTASFAPDAINSAGATEYETFSTSIEFELLRIEDRMRRLWITAAETNWGAGDAGLWSLYLDGSSVSPPAIQRLGAGDEIVEGAINTPVNYGLGLVTWTLSGFQNVRPPVPGFRDTSALQQAPFNAIRLSILHDVKEMFNLEELDCDEVKELGVVVLPLGGLSLSTLRVGETVPKGTGVNKRVGDQVHFDSLNYHGIFEIPGNLAGGGSTPPGPGGGALGQIYADERWVEGYVMITPHGPDTVKVDFVLEMCTFDTVDFIPGNIGEGMEKWVTQDLYALEAYDHAYDVPYEVRFALTKDTFPDEILTIHHDDPDDDCDDKEEDEELKRERGGGGSTGLVHSSDPNDIIGPAGYGESHYMRVDQNFPYTILFENKPVATAPAQEVVITHQLDTDLDWSTFQLGDFGFDDVTIHVPQGLSFYQTRVDLSEMKGFLVDFTAGIDLNTGIATWRFVTLDPETGDLVSDPQAGFLPPNDATHRGEGFVGYSISPLATLTTGATIYAQASIVFDTNAPLLTPIYMNKIDTGVPTSTVTALAPTQDFPTFTVSWSGIDDAAGPTGSGIASFAIYVSDNGAEFVPFLLGTSQTSASFTGQVNHTYSFYSVATDGVGFRQATPTVGQTSTQVLDVLFDFGDAPDPFFSTPGKYPTLLADDGARHKLVSGLVLGSIADRDFDGQPTATANGDDADGVPDDEDGVVLPGLVRGTTGSATVTASQAGKLDAWIDFNRDGDWLDADEQIATGLTLNAGSNNITFAVPAAASTGATFARFRLSSAGGLASTGPANDGEVEDYQVQISPPLLTQLGAAVTLLKKQPPVVVLPAISIANGNLSNGTLTININAVGTAKKQFDVLTAPAFSVLGTSSGLQFANGHLTLQIQLNANVTASAIQNFLRGITFGTKGKGFKTFVRTLQVTLANSTGTSTSATQTINVKKK